MKLSPGALILLGTRYLERRGIFAPRYSSEELLSYALKIERRADLYTEHNNSVVSFPVIADFFEMIRRRAKRYPLQYLTGKAGFMEHVLSVCPGVFIPRPETELLVERCAQWLVMRKGMPQVLDIGTGSGNIALSLAAAFPHARVTGLDISDKALSIAKKNARQAGVYNNIDFINSDCMCVELKQQYDLIVSNPPYITQDEMESLDPEVLCEPVTALAGGKDGLDYYRMIVLLGSTALRKNGMLAFEVGNKQAEKVKDMLEKRGFANISIYKDYSNIQRVVTGELN